MVSSSFSVSPKPSEFGGILLPLFACTLFNVVGWLTTHQCITLLSPDNAQVYIQGIFAHIVGLVSMHLHLP